jgi:hypothetical protein
MTLHTRAPYQLACFAGRTRHRTLPRLSRSAPLPVVPLGACPPRHSSRRTRHRPRHRPRAVRERRHRVIQPLTVLVIIVPSRHSRAYIVLTPDQRRDVVVGNRPRHRPMARARARGCCRARILFPAPSSSCPRHAWYHSRPWSSTSSEVRMPMTL